MKHSNITKLLILIAFFSSLSARQKKLIGLVGARNESYIITQCIKALSKYTDAIVFLDDASEDDTVAKVEALAQECHVEKIIRKTTWYRDEPGDKNKLLEAGRELGGTHFIVLDADEMLSANCMRNNLVRKFILNLHPGDKIVFRLIDLWRNPHQFRVDKSSIYSHRILDFAFADDGKCYYDSEFIHTSHSPQHRTGTEIALLGNFVILHFAFVNWRDVQIKYAWYRCLERIRTPKKSAQDINEFYEYGLDERGIQYRQANPVWFEGYSFFDPTIFYNDEPSWRELQIYDWFTEYGKDHFKDLDIWHIDWRLQ